jgi:hypothetical protein
MGKRTARLSPVLAAVLAPAEQPVLKFRRVATPVDFQFRSKFPGFFAENPREIRANAALSAAQAQAARPVPAADSAALQASFAGRLAGDSDNPGGFAGSRDSRAEHTRYAWRVRN